MVRGLLASQVHEHVGLVSFQGALWLGPLVVYLAAWVCLLNVGEKVGVDTVVDARGNELDAGGFVVGQDDVCVLLGALDVIVHLWSAVVDVLEC